MNQKEVDLKTLSIIQLEEIRKQIQLELNHFTNSYSKLKQAQFKFQECKNTVNLLMKQENDHKEILVPLTSSLYVSGFLFSNQEKVLVDIGTGYYVEKTIEGAIKFYEERIKYLDINLRDLEVVNEIIQEKIKNSQMSTN
ncbi:hypothetical protein PCANB_002777 [Pneumocystis canis]|nr:hypothetical protein PCANB_002777 [Pneumocystis canis]